MICETHRIAMSLSERDRGGDVWTCPKCMQATVRKVHTEYLRDELGKLLASKREDGMVLVPEYLLKGTLRCLTRHAETESEAK